MTRFLVNRAKPQFPVRLEEYAFPIIFKTQKWLYFCCIVIFLIGMLVVFKGVNDDNIPGIWIGLAITFASIIAMIYLFRRAYLLTKKTITIQTMFKKRQINIHQVNKIEVTNQYIYLFYDDKKRVELDPFIANMSLFLNLIRQLALQNDERRL
ncbi:hypothetical protein NST84_06890 [Paenibacillus sp. FSL R7-0345]|uniref:hypothetical protein n=1 Tax=Paenibacillus sp. FSL R7-0345 TaxID=2954535 RepID=UPI00315B2218